MPRRIPKAVYVWLDRNTPWIFVGLVFIAAASFGILYSHVSSNNSHIKELVVENKHRIRENKQLIKRQSLIISEIQASRVRSCRSNYASFTSIFRPFFPSDRKDWTPKQTADWLKLQRIVKEKQKTCVVQTRPAGPPSFLRNLPH